MTDTIILKNGSEVKVPAGCQDIALFRRFAEAKANPKPRKPARQPADSGRRNRRRTLATVVPFPALTVTAQAKRTGKAMAQLVERVNEAEAVKDNSWFTINTGPGGFTARVSREDNEVSYVDDVLNDNLKAGCCVRGW